MKEVLHLRTDHGLLGVHGDPQDHRGQHPRHPQVLLTYKHTNNDRYTPHIQTQTKIDILLTYRHTNKGSDQ